MQFTDPIFLPFLIALFFVFAALRNRPRGQLVAFLVGSYLFYAWWDARFLLLIVFSTGLDFQLGKAIHASDDPRRRRHLVCLSLVGNLGLLGYFKYANFFIASSAQALDVLGFDIEPQKLAIVLPIGISFYTFQTLSYTLDIYRRQLEPTESLLEFMVYVAAFPQLVAGPIVRARDLLPQLRGNLFARSDSAGFFYFAYGLVKKVCLADPLGANVVDPLYGTPAKFGSLDAIFGLHAYSLQIFLDFSAYSDMAIGLGLLFGLTLPVNFRSPYASANPTEFWRRWHITLSTWLRDYLYVSLGGNRVARHRLYLNLMIVMVLGGLWHGASWTFVAWGALHGVYLIAHRIYSARNARLGSVPRYGVIGHVIRVFLLVECVTLTWVLFRSSDLTQVFKVFSALGRGGFQARLLSPEMLCVFSLAVGLHYFVEGRLADLAKRFRGLHYALQGGLLYIFAVLLYAFLREGTRNQAFIYFQF
jgi:alginate O-acetyltransferase complex protein AlgI